jgi:aryl-alcohol dehydrogenase-like predicted oxidoreductase
MKLALGTVQFGLDYGVSNISGQVGVPEVRSVLQEARKHSIDTLDTAAVYGNSESVLGEVGVDQFNIVTKLPPIPKNVGNVDLWVSSQVESSLRKMCVSSVSGLLLHRASDLTEDAFRSQLFNSLCKLKDKGIINKIGVSIYNPEELDALEEYGIKVDIVQAPFNILDRRLESSGWLHNLNLAGIEVHTRSVFLQGLLLQKKEQRNSYFNKWNNYFKIFDEWVKDTRQTPLGASLNFSNSYKSINKVIVGVQNKSQLTEILASISQDSQFSVPSELEIDDLMLINPSNWILGGYSG